MKSALIIFSLLGLIAVGLAATSTGYHGDPAHPGMCVMSDNLILTPGTHQAPDGCMKIECSESGFVATYTCGVQGAGPGCKMSDYTRPEADYPDCCHREVICS